MSLPSEDGAGREGLEPWRKIPGSQPSNLYAILSSSLVVLGSGEVLELTDWGRLAEEAVMGKPSSLWGEDFLPWQPQTYQSSSEQSLTLAL